MKNEMLSGMKELLEMQQEAALKLQQDMVGIDDGTESPASNSIGPASNTSSTSGLHANAIQTAVHANAIQTSAHTILKGRQAGISSVMAVHPTVYDMLQKQYGMIENSLSELNDEDRVELSEGGNCVVCDVEKERLDSQGVCDEGMCQSLKGLIKD